MCQAWRQVLGMQLLTFLIKMGCLILSAIQDIWTKLQVPQL